MLHFCIPMQATFPLACSILKVVAHAILKVMVAFQDMDQWQRYAKVDTTKQIIART